MPTVYSQSKSTTFQINPNLRYRLYENAEEFRWVRIQNDGQGPYKTFWIEIPFEIAADLGAILLSKKNNELFKSRR